MGAGYEASYEHPKFWQSCYTNPLQAPGADKKRNGGISRRWNGDYCCKIAWVLKNSFQGISITKFVRKLLNVRSPQTLEFAEITALVPFSTPTPDFASCLAACFDRAISIANFDWLW